MPRIEDVPPSMLERYFMKLFSIADANGDGVLQPAEFERLLQSSGFNFSQQQISDMMLAADTNRNGVIEYEEFVPVARSLLMGQQDVVDNFIDAVDEADARQQLMQGRNLPMFEREMKKKFLFADKSCTGTLDFKEFRNIVAQMGFPLSPVQTQELMRMVDVNADGKVNYEDFVSVALEMMVKVVIGKNASKLAPPQVQPLQAPSGVRSPPASSDIASLEGRVLAVQSRRIIRSKIKDLFNRMDTDNDGRLTLDELRSALGVQLVECIQATLDPSNDGRVTQYEMRRFFDQECSSAVHNGIPEHRYLEGIVDMLESAI